MATVQDALDIAESLNGELRLQSGENDVIRGIVIYKMALRHFETKAAAGARILGGSVTTVTTTVNTETTAFPTGYMRVDRLQLQFSNGQVKRTLERVSDYEHAVRRFGFSSSSSKTGEPDGYWTNGTLIYWVPLPDGTHTVRFSGFAVSTAASGSTDATDTFPYNDIVLDPVGAFIAEVFNVRVDDTNAELQLMSARLFQPVLEVLSNFQRDGSRIPSYRQVHRI